jgi:anti-sigma factor RsiW
MTMECRDVRQLAESFVSQQLLLETSQRINAHLDSCAACRAEVQGLARLRAATRSAIEAAPSLDSRPEFLSSLPAVVQAEAAQQSGRATSHRMWLAIAASLLLVVAVGAGWRGWSVSRLTELVEAAVGDHRFCALDFKLTEAPVTLEEAARRYDAVNRTIAAVEPPARALSGGALEILERHSCVFNGRRFAHIVLRYRSQPVSLLVAHAPDPGVWQLGPPDDGTTALFPGGDGFQVVGFRGSRHMVFVVSSLESHDIQEVARAMAGPVRQALAGA